MPPPQRGPGAGGPASPQGQPVVSGPGAMSRRTDTGPAQKISQLPNAQYGENATYQDLQQSAPLNQSAGSPSGGGPAGLQNMNAAASSVVPFSAPSSRPNEPVTSGAALGPGPGNEALGLNLNQNESQDIRSLANYLPAMEFMANQRDALPSSRMAVNMIRAGVQQ